MENNLKKNQVSEEEIDLAAFVKSIGAGIKKVFIGFLNVLVNVRGATRSNYKLISVLCVVCISLGLTYKFVSKPYYESTMVIKSVYFNESIHASLFEKLNQLCEEDNHIQVSKMLGLTIYEAKMLKGISIEPVMSNQEILDFEILKNNLEDKAPKGTEINHLIEKIQAQSGSAYKIKVLVYDPMILEILEQPLVTFIKSNEFIKKRIEINRTNLLAKKAKLESEIKKLDTLREVIQSGLTASAQRVERTATQIFMGETSTTDPIEILQEDQKRFLEILAIEKALYIESDFEVVDGLVSFQQPSGLPLIWIIGYSLLAAIVVSYFIILFVGLNKLLDRLEDKNDRIIRMSEQSDRLKSTGT